jgi:hypothetical protein
VAWTRPGAPTVTRRVVVVVAAFGLAVAMVLGETALPFGLRVLAVLGFGAGFCFLGEAALLTVEEVRRRRVPWVAKRRVPPELVVHPFDEHDPFCTCPNCGQVADHHVQVITWSRERVWVYPRDHESIIRGIGDPPDGTQRARRRCRCGHVWYTHARQHARRTS